MGFFAAVTREDVIRAVDEYDRLGQDAFLDTYGFRPARAYVLVFRQKTYDSKAIAGLAYQYATGRPLGWKDFNGGVSREGAATVLDNLGFVIKNVRDGD